MTEINILMIIFFGRFPLFHVPVLYHDGLCYTTENCDVDVAQVRADSDQ
jgi:hypothetical protein